VFSILICFVSVDEIDLLIPLYKYTHLFLLGEEAHGKKGQRAASTSWKM